MFLDSQLRLTLIDFGLSEFLGPDKETLTPGGTLHAMSPEMLILYTKVATEQKDKVDPKKNAVGFAHDYYTLGVLLLEIIDPEIIHYFPRLEPGAS